jgi:AsmA protein
MSKRVKFFLMVFVVALFVFIVAISIVPDWVNPNNYKTQIAAIFKEKTGRDIAINGDIRLSIFPWLGLDAERIEISNKPGFQPLPFLTVKKGGSKIKLLPLLTKKLEIDAIHLDGLVLNLVKDKQGNNNWNDLWDAKSLSEDEFANSKAITGWALGAVMIKNSQFNWDDKQNDKHLELKNIDFDADSFTYEAPVKMNVAMDISGNLIQFPMRLKGETHLRVDEKHNNFVFIDSLIEGIGYKNTSTVEALTATFKISRIGIDWIQQKLLISEMQGQSGDMNLSVAMKGEQIRDKPSYSGSSTIAPFNPKKVMQNWDIAVPALSDDTVLSDDTALSELSLAFDFQMNLDKVEIRNLVFALDNSHGQGFITVNDLDKPKFRFDLAIDTIDADRYLAPEKTSTRSNAVATFSNRLASSLDGIKKWDAEGNLSLNKMVSNRILMQELRLSISSRKGKVNAHQKLKE